VQATAGSPALQAALPVAYTFCSLPSFVRKSFLPASSSSNGSLGSWLPGAMKKRMPLAWYSRRMAAMPSTFTGWASSV
jgi:hypothetical protein